MTRKEQIRAMKALVRKLEDSVELARDVLAVLEELQRDDEAVTDLVTEGRKHS